MVFPYNTLVVGKIPESLFMLSYNELKPGIIFVKDGEPHKVLEYSFTRMQQSKPVVQVKIRSLISGKVVNYTARQSDSFEEAEMELIPANFIYRRNGEYWFHEVGNPKSRFMLTDEVVGDEGKFLKGNLEVSASKFNGEIINIELPVKVDLEVTEAPPSIKGNTAQGGTKSVTLETGASVNVPLFVNTGDVVRINTQTGEYAERVEKA